MKHRGKFRAMVVLAVMALAAAACGGDDGDSGEAAGTTAAGQGAATTVAATGTPIKVGIMCDQTGPTSLVGLALCPGATDYIDLVNSQGGVDGHPLEPIFVEMAYEVPRGVAAYHEMVSQGAVAIVCFGTPIALALVEASAQSQVPCLTPGFGVASATDGEEYPYQFPLAASYVSQGAAAVDYVLGESEGDPSELKVAYMYYDNAAGQEPIVALESMAEQQGFELRTFAVPPPGLEMTAQVTDIVSRYQPDWLITHLFGRAPSVSITTLKRAGFPLDQVVSLVWGFAENDIEAAGGYDFAEGYRGLQFAGVGDGPVREEIRAMYEARGEDAPEEMESSVYYNRGVYTAALMVEGVRASVAAGVDPVTGTSVKEALESFEDKVIGSEDLAPPLTTGLRDHEGGGFTRVYQVQDGGFEPLTDWSNSQRPLVFELLGIPPS
ncbi:MAG: ABC transporter substrate-binding protein [Acidimicrobiia bacterium]|nr:ABC transporter substrate-binding protein [Acidimicrobiia bacterium]